MTVKQPTVVPTRISHDTSPCHQRFWTHWANATACVLVRHHKV
ncbi:hypothetical protein [Moraxella lacunata]